MKKLIKCLEIGFAIFLVLSIVAGLVQAIMVSGATAVLFGHHIGFGG